MHHAAHDIALTSPQTAQFGLASSPPLNGAMRKHLHDPEILQIWAKRDEMPRRAFSRAISEVVGRPVLVVDLEDMPYAPTRRETGNHTEANFTPEQINARAHYLQTEAQAVLPEAKPLWEHWKWAEITANICAPNIDEMLVKFDPNADPVGAKNRPARLIGDFWDSAAVIFAPDRRWTVAQEWQNLTGLGNLLEYHPPGSGVRTYTGGHETTHVLQRRQSMDKSHSHPQQAELAKWVIERDADKLPLHQLKQLGHKLLVYAKQHNLRGEAMQANRDERRALVETAVAVKHMRALSSFLVSTPRYWIALGLDSPQRLGLLPEPRDPTNQEAADKFLASARQAAEKSLLVGYEVRWRVAAQLAGTPLTKSSKEVQAEIKEWWDNPGPGKQAGTPHWELNYWFSDIFSRDKQAKSPDELKKNFFWGTVNDVRAAIPALKEVIASGAMTDPLAVRNSNLILNAAYYFMPSMKNAPHQPKAQLSYLVAVEHAL